MKKRWMAICTAGLLAFGMTGCGGNASSGDNASSGSTSSADAQNESAKEEEAAGTENAAGEEVSGETESEMAEKGSGETGFVLDAVLYDQEGLKITASEYRIDESGSSSIIVQVENGTDSMIGFDCTSLELNGFVLEAYDNLLTSAEEVATQIEMMKVTSAAAGEDFEEIIENEYHMVPAGETAEKEIDAFQGDIGEAYIGTIQQIDISLAAMKFTNPEDLTAQVQGMPEGELVTIQTDAFGGEIVLPEIEGTEIYNQDGIRMVVLDMAYEYGTLDIGLYLENNSDKSIILQENDALVNETSVGTYKSMCYYLKSNGRTVGELYSMEAGIESLDDIRNLEFTVEILDQSTWETIGTAAYTYEP